MSVLRATPDDIPWIAEQIEIFNSTLNTKHSLLPTSLDKELEALQNDHVLLVAWYNGDRAGMIGGQFTSHPYNPDVSLLLERFWWVNSYHRRKGVGASLLRAFVDAGKDCDIIHLSSLPGRPVPAEVIEELDFRQAETAYIKEN